MQHYPMSPDTSSAIRRSDLAEMVTVQDTLFSHRPDSLPRETTSSFAPDWSSDAPTALKMRYSLVEQTTSEKTEIILPVRKLEPSTPDWVAGILLLVLLLLASVRVIFNKYLKQLLAATVNANTFSRLYRDRQFNLFHASVRLDITFFLVFPLFVYQLLDINRIGSVLFPGILHYLVSFAAVSGYFMIKRTLYSLVGVLVQSPNETNEFLFNMNVYNRVLGLFLFPITVVIAFASLSDVRLAAWAGVMLTALCYLLTLLRGAKILLKKEFSISYLILYLCSLEILPLLLIYKIVLD